MTLRSRLFIAALPVLLLFAAYNSLLLLRRERVQLEEETRARAQATADLLASSSAYAMQTVNPTLLQSNVNSAFLQPDVRQVSVIDTHGLVIACSDPSLNGSPAQPEAAGSETLNVSAPVTLGGRSLGRVDLSLSTRSMLDAVGQARQQVLVTSLLLLLAVSVLTVIAAHRLALPLGIMAVTADQMADGYLSSRVPVGRHGIRGDLEPLGVTFNRMAERLERRVRAERSARALLGQRVARLLEFTTKVSQGDLEQQAHVFADDDLGQLADDFNQILTRLRALLATEQGFRAALEQSTHDLQEAHARLSLSDRQKTDFLVVVSHELRTPLTAVKAFAELLIDGVDDPAMRIEFLTIVQREAERLTRLINNLLDLSRIDAGRMNWRRDRFSLSRLARAALEPAEIVAQERAVRIDLLIADERVIEGDLERLAQALSELMQNAVHASPPDAAVRVSLSDPGSAGNVCIVVEDRGCGIDPTHHVAIFERFWQVTKPTRGRELERPRGSGLGLPLAKAIAVAHGGSISVESTGVAGEVTRFMLVLPLVPLESRVANLLTLAESYLGRTVDSARWRDMLNKLLDTQS